MFTLDYCPSCGHICLVYNMEEGSAYGKYSRPSVIQTSVVRLRDYLPPEIVCASDFTHVIGLLLASIEDRKLLNFNNCRSFWSKT